MKNLSAYVPYLLGMVALSLGVLLALTLGQRALLRRLSRALYEREDPAHYDALLHGFAARVLLRPATRALLKLEAALYLQNDAAVWQAAQTLDTLRLKPGEKLNYYRRVLGYAATVGKAQQAHAYAERLQALLKAETDPQLQEILQDARLLVGVYIDKDPALLPELLDLAAGQTGQSQGLTQYRLAKLYHGLGQDGKAKRVLEKACQTLEGTAWYENARAAIEDPGLLDTM